MAPFVSPLVEGKLVEQRRIQTNTFKPAYIKDKRAPDLRKPIRRQIGERIGGEPAKGPEREMANIMFEMEDQVDMVQRRLEWMAAQVLLTGTLLVAGSGFEPVTIDFGRSSTLTIDLTGAAQWGQAGVVPTQDIEAWQKQILRRERRCREQHHFHDYALGLFPGRSDRQGRDFLSQAGRRGQRYQSGSADQIRRNL